MTENIIWHQGSVARQARSELTGGPGATIWLTGLSGSGKSSIAYEAESHLIGIGRAAYVLDGDNLRHGINADLGFGAEDRGENVRRVGEIALLMADAGLVTLAPVISPYRADRARVRARHELAGVRFLEVFVDTPLNVCEERDPKGLYARARAGEIRDMTGIDDPYEAPLEPDLTIDGEKDPIPDAVKRIVHEISVPDVNRGRDG